MNKELAISILRGDVLGTNEQTHEAVFMAIKALEVEPVVRCKDCKYVIPYESGGFNCLSCPNVDRDVDENWFCADGESRTEVEE